MTVVRTSRRRIPPPVMSPEERRKLIEAPIRFNIFGPSYGHGGCSVEENRLKPSKIVEDTDYYREEE